MFCPKCASQVSESESVCPRCGAPVDPSVYTYKRQESYPDTRYKPSSAPYKYEPPSSSSTSSSSYSSNSYSTKVDRSSSNVRIAEDVPSSGMNIALGYIFAPIGLIVAIVQLVIGKTPNKTTSLFKSIGIAVLASVIMTILWVVATVVIGVSKMSGWGILVFLLLGLVSLAIFIAGIIIISKMTKKDIIKAQSEQGGVPIGN